MLDYDQRIRRARQAMDRLGLGVRIEDIAVIAPDGGLEVPQLIRSIVADGGLTVAAVS